MRWEWPAAFPQATRDLAQYDAAHHEEFKRYEMLKEHERRRYLESLGEEQRKEAERKLEEQQSEKFEAASFLWLLGFRNLSLFQK